MSTTSHPTQELLAQLSADLRMPSETDSPFTAFFWPAEGELSEEEISDAAGVSGDAGAEEATLSEFLDDAAAEEDWMREEELTAARQFQALRAALLENLTDATVLLFGERNRCAVILGKVKTPPSGYAGLITHVVET